MPHATWHSGNTVHKPRTNGTAQAQRIIKAGTRPHEARGAFSAQTLGTSYTDYSKAETRPGPFRQPRCRLSNQTGGIPTIF